MSTILYILTKAFIVKVVNSIGTPLFNISESISVFCVKTLIAFIGI